MTYEFAWRLPLSESPKCGTNNCFSFFFLHWESREPLLREHISTHYHWNWSIEIIQLTNYIENALVSNTWTITCVGTTSIISREPIAMSHVKQWPAIVVWKTEKPLQLMSNNRKKHFCNAREQVTVDIK